MSSDLAIKTTANHTQYFKFEEKFSAEIVVLFFSYLKPKDLCTISLVSKECKMFADDDKLWKQLIRRRFTYIGKEPLNYKEEYKEDRAGFLWVNIAEISRTADADTIIAQFKKLPESYRVDCIAAMNITDQKLTTSQYANCIINFARGFEQGFKS